MTATITKPPRKPWRQSEVALLAVHFAHYGLDGVLQAFPAADHGRVTAKLRQLNLIPKMEKETLTDESEAFVDTFIAHLKAWHDGQRVLGARYAMKALAEFLPKRAKK